MTSRHTAFSCRILNSPTVGTATHESNVPGIYLAGVIVAGERTNEIFIENGRFHGKLIADSLRSKLLVQAEV